MEEIKNLQELKEKIPFNKSPFILGKNLRIIT